MCSSGALESLFHLKNVFIVLQVVLENVFVLEDLSEKYDWDAELECLCVSVFIFGSADNYCAEA